MSISEQLTYSTVLILCEYKDGTTGSGTGFIMNFCYNEEEKTVIPTIVTNNHVVDNSIKTIFQFCLEDKNGNPVDNKVITVTVNGNIWIHHPDPSVDLSCLLLAQLIMQVEQQGQKIFYIPLETKLIPTLERVEDLAAMEDIVMVGYPIGLSDIYNHKPIIRKGITATHIKKNYQGKKEFLIDMACFPGSSGSPIFILNDGAFLEKQVLKAGSRCIFIGILYGGPQYSAQGDLQLMALPNSHQIHSVTQIPTNLGVAIKAERLLEFEPLLANLNNNKESNNGQVGNEE